MKDFVTFEISKKLKEKGFREKCFAIYIPYSRTFKFNEINVDKRPTSYKLNIEEFRECYNYYKENNIDAPTISQVLKWLREEKELHIEIYMYHNCYLWEIYNTKIYDADFTQKSEKYSEIEYETYEQAALAGIEYVLDNLI